MCNRDNEVQNRQLHSLLAASHHHGPFAQSCGLVAGGLLGQIVTLALPSVVVAAETGHLSVGGIISQIIAGGAGGAILTAIIGAIKLGVRHTNLGTCLRSHSQWIGSLSSARKNFVFI
jgi:hypothetical protein